MSESFFTEMRRSSSVLSGPLKMIFSGGTPLLTALWYSKIDTTSAQDPS